jgi:hypothetical protein
MYHCWISTPKIPASWHRFSETNFSNERADAAFLKIFFFAAAGKNKSNRRVEVGFVARSFKLSPPDWLPKSCNYTALSPAARNEARPVRPVLDSNLFASKPATRRRDTSNCQARERTGNVPAKAEAE